MIEYPYFVAGLSKYAIEVVYGNRWPIQGDCGMCRPKEDIHFNYDEYFLTCDTYPYQAIGNGMYDVLSTSGLAINGLITIDKEVFDQYFTIENKT